MSANGIRDAAKRAIAGARGKPVTGIGVAMPAAGDTVPPDIAAALRDASSRDTDVITIAAGTAAAIAEQWCGAARGLKQVVTFSIAEHVTAGVLLNGQPWLGAHGLASSVGWLAHQSGRARRLSALRRPRSRDRVGRHRPAVRLAHQVRRSIGRRRSGQGRLLRRSPSTTSSRPAAPATACRSRWCATPRNTSAWRSPTWRRCSIRRTIVLGGMHRAIRAT